MSFEKIPKRKRNNQEHDDVNWTGSKNTNSRLRKTVRNLKRYWG